MAKNGINIKPQILQKLLDFSREAPFFSSYLSLFNAANKVSSEILERDTLIFAINPNEFDLYEIYYFERDNLTISPQMFYRCSEGNINYTARILSKRDEAIIIDRDRIKKFINENNVNAKETLPQSAMFSPIVDRFDEKIGIAFLCGDIDYTQDDLEIFRQFAKVIGAGLNNIEKYELFSLYDEEYSEIVNNPVLGIVKISNDYKILKANDTFAKILGFRDAKELFEPENQNYIASLEATRRFKKELSELKENDLKINNKEFLVQNKFGNRIWLNVTARYHVSYDRQWSFFEILVNDITLLKNAEKELRINRKIYETILSVSFDGIVLIDQNQNILDINDILAKRYGHKRSFYLGKPVTIFGGESRKVRENIEKLKDGIIKTNYIEHLSPDGKRYYYELSEQMIQLPKGEKIIVSMSRDITDNVKGRQNNAALIANIDKVTNYLAAFQEAVYLRMKEEKSLLVRLEKQLSDNVKENDREIYEELQKYIEETKCVLRTIELISSLNQIQLRENKKIKDKFDLVILISDEINKNLEILLDDYDTSISFTSDCKTCEFSMNKIIAKKMLTEIITNAVKYSKGSPINIVLNKNKIRQPVITISSGGIPISSNFLNDIYLPLDKKSGYYLLSLPRFASSVNSLEIRINYLDKPMLKTIY